MGGPPGLAQGALYTEGTQHTEGPPVEVQFVRISNLAKLSRPTGHSLFLNYFHFFR